MSVSVIPSVHLNGTSAEGLKKQLADAMEALDRARDALSAASPHGRDYYVQQDPNAYQTARAEHLIRLAHVEEAHADLLQLWKGVEEQDRDNHS